MIGLSGRNFHAETRPTFRPFAGILRHRVWFLSVRLLRLLSGSVSTVSRGLTECLFIFAGPVRSNRLSGRYTKVCQAYAKVPTDSQQPFVR
jgi:hypothetical protein